MGKRVFSWVTHALLTLAACVPVVTGLCVPGGVPRAFAAPSEAESIAQKAAERFRAGDFEVAAKLFMQAYAKSHRPDAVFNAARAYENAGKRGDAAGLFRLYISLATDPGGIQEAGQHLTKLEAAAPPPEKPSVAPQTAPVAAPQPAPAAVAPPKPVVAPKSVVVVDGPAAADAVVVAQPPLAVQKPPEVQAASRTLGWTLVASGAALAATGLGLGIWAAIDRADLQSKVTRDSKTNLVERISYSAAQQRNADIFSRSIWAGVLGGVGVAAAATGGWQLWSAPAGGARAVVLPAPNGASLAVRF